MMTLETYKKRYLAAYAKYSARINILCPAYDDAQIKEAYKNFTERKLWYYRAFKPGTLAETNVKFYDYLVIDAIRWYYNDWVSDDSILKMCREHPDEVCKIVGEYGLAVHPQQD